MGPLARLRMRAVSLLILAPGILALPQDLGSLLGGFLGNRGGGRSLQNTVRNIINNPVIQERILNNDLNPCPGELPSNCVCTNGNSFQPSNFLDLNQGNPCGRGARPDTCTCPSEPHSGPTWWLSQWRTGTTSPPAARVSSPPSASAGTVPPSPRPQ